MNSEVERRTQHSRGNEVPVVDILGKLAELIYTKAALKPVGFDELGELRLQMIFMVCHRQYHDDHSGLGSRTRRCDIDVRDFLAGRIDLPRYVVCAFEEGVRLSAAQIEVIRNLENAPGEISSYDDATFEKNPARLPSTLRTAEIRRSFPKSVWRFLAWCKAMCGRSARQLFSTCS